MQSYCRRCNIYTRGIYFSLDSSWDDAVVVTIIDASFCPEQEQIDGVTQNFKSQQACITALALGNALNAEKMLIHPLSWSSTRIRRVCRSTLTAEAYALSNAVEHGLRIRATIVDMRGPQYSSMGVVHRYVLAMHPHRGIHPHRTWWPGYVKTRKYPLCWGKTGCDGSSR